ncbi:type IX secretion system sortase PorU [uncultured Psychroserpens sp.]|uniref:type IX secretion system sortase PorU n=1 Tax=uncultured Psychroserpens sp. TaxID=255436 RepID=UPI0026392B03|nr:type IX secretion system sortase PorU [uncultured Psychroserpens sp.]
MKKYLLFPLIVASFFGYSQQKQFDVAWSEPIRLETGTSSIEVPSFDKKHFSFLREEGLTFYAQWEETSYINENSVTLSQVTYQNISESELKGLALSTIPTSMKVSLKNAIDRDQVSAYLEVSPIIKDRGVYKKVMSFTVNYQYGNLNRSGLTNQEITNSVLSSGTWHKFYVDKSGVFRLTKGFLNSIGVNTNVDPRTIKVYGNGGAMLPALNSDFYPLDLTENAVRFIGEEDGVFNNDDYILFYAEGPREYSEDSDTNINLFTDKSYYFINTDGGAGKRIQTLNQPEGDATIEVNTFQDYQFHEEDEANIAKIGRRWFGERFDVENERTFNFSFPNLITTEPAKVRVLAAGVSEGPIASNMQIVLNGNLVSTLGFSVIDNPVLASGNTFQSNINLTSEDVVIDLIFNNNGNPAALGYLDYISIEATRGLTFDGTQLIFKNNEVALNPGIAQYTLDNASNVQEVWDITDKYNVQAIINTDQSQNLIFKDVAGSNKRYVTLTNLDYFDPLRDANTTVNNQNIKGTIFQNAQGEFQDIDYIIVARGGYVTQAERLAQINREQYNLNVKVVELEAIFNEFSSGNQDIAAIRNMVKYVYDNASSPSRRLKYLCLFGDASYDPKNRISNNTNIIPIWSSYQSFSLTSSFISDDFYGMMDENEGDMNDSDRLDIAVGRMLADTPQRAKELVDKVEGYYGEEAFGSWRNNFITISDDVNLSWEKILQNTTDEIGDEVVQEKPFINVVKIHTDAFQQEATASGERYPEVNKAIKDALEVGALVVNYFGHGGEDGLAGERIFTKVDAQDIRNVCKFNLFVTVTCEYTKFDNPQRFTAGEFTYWNKDGGAIGLITTTRQIFVTAGVGYNVILEQYLFSYGSNDYPTMAEALRLTKNDPALSGNPQKTLVFYIGDPAMKLAFARPEVRLTQINDTPLDQFNEPLKALDRVKMSGEVYDTSGNFLSNYNGVLTATVFDKEIDRQTLANDGTTDNGQVIVLDFKTLGETVFKGQATVTEGRFDFEFVVPRDIGIPVGPGKVSFYSKQDNILDDKSGYNFDFDIGGINENATEDNVGPVINLFMNDENFVSGGITNEQPTLLAKLQDDNGINTASGIGHDIIAIIDGDETNPFVLNDYYQADIDDFQRGQLSYPFRDLEPGLHTLSLKAWDVYNNSSTAEIEFVVRDKDEELVISNVLNYPNPFIDYTEFWFNHNSSDVLDVSVQIFTVSGKLVRTLNGQTAGGSKVTSSLSKDIVWDGRDDFGDKIGKGVYIYKLKVRSNRLNKQVEKIEKLVIL